MLAETTTIDTLVQVMSEAFLISGSKKSTVRAVCLGVPGLNHPDPSRKDIKLVEVGSS